MGLLVGHQRPVRGVRSVDARRKPGLPEHLIPGEEGHVHARIEGGLDVRALLPGPVLVVAGRKEDLVLLDYRRGAGLGHVNATGVAHVIPVLLQETDHRVLGVHEPAASAGSAGDPRPVVGHRGGALVGLGGPRGAVVAALVQAVAGSAGPGVVGLPRLVVGLEQDVGVAGVVADDERDQAAAAGVVTHQVRDVQPGHGCARHRPRRRHRPVAAVDEPGGLGVVDARGLSLRQRGGRQHVRDHLARAVALVVADAQDVDVVRRRRGVDLEGFGLPHVHAHRGGEALDRRVPRAVYLPVAGRVTRQGVLASDHAGHRRATRASCSRWSHTDQGEQTERHREGEADSQPWPRCPA